MNVTETENAIIKEFVAAHERGDRIFICGGGSGASVLYEKVCQSDGRDIDIEAFVLNDEYYDSCGTREMLGYPVIPMRELDTEDPRMFACIAYMHYDYFTSDPVPPKCRGRFVIFDVTTFFDKTATGSFLDYDYFTENSDAFKELYDALSDDKSRQVFDAYINQRISGDFRHLRAVKDDDQYYDTDIIDIGSITGIVDCGAYDGDSYEAFLAKYRKVTGRDFAGQAWLWEAEKKNADILTEKFSDNPNVHILGIGVGKEKGRLTFGGDGVSGKIGKGDDFIDIDSIDDLVTGKPGFIKMDVEGAEYDALIGAEKTIKDYTPALAICVYHKRDDLIAIPRLIKSFDSRYRFYLRAYSYHATEIVLYAVAKEQS